MKFEHLVEFALLLNLLVKGLRKSMEISLEDLYVDIRAERVNKERAKMAVSPSIKRAIRGKHNYSSYLVVYFGPKRFLLIALFISFGCENVKEYLSRSGTGPLLLEDVGFFSESLVSLTDETSSSLSYNL